MTTCVTRPLAVVPGSPSISMRRGNPNCTPLPWNGDGSGHTPGSGCMSLTRASVSSRFADCTTTIPNTNWHGSGPLTVSPDIRTCAPCPTRTMAVNGVPVNMSCA
jgi:hypothetical protein